MSGTTFNWTGKADIDWTNPANWDTNTVPDSKTAVVNVNIGPDTLISNGASITVGTLTISGTGANPAHLVVGGAPGFLGDGFGTLVAETIIASSNDAGGVIVGGLNGTIEATVMTIPAADAIAAGAGIFNIGTIINDGTILGDGALFGIGPLVVNSPNAITGKGVLEVQGPSTFELNAPTSQDMVVNVLNTPTVETATVIFGDSTSFTGSLNLKNPDSHVNLFFKGQTPTGATYDAGTSSLIITGASGTIDVIPVTGNAPFAVGVRTSTIGGFGEVAIVCYARGTLIRTPSGDRAVEDLKEGDAVLTANGGTEAIKWVGRRSVNCRQHPAPETVWPIRIKAGALGHQLPKRDLVLSPQHAILAEGVLIPAKILVNGVNVVVDETDSIEYYHIELPHHDLLVAEGLAAESYLENGDRGTFENSDEPTVLHPDFSRWTWDARACAELKVVGPEVDRVKATLQRNGRRRSASKPSRRVA